MKNLTYCNTINRLLANNQINCDILILTNETLQCTIGFKSMIKNEFTDKLVNTAFSFTLTEVGIIGLSNLCKNTKLNYKEIRNSLTVINTLCSGKKIYNAVSTYQRSLKEFNELDTKCYMQFYSSRSDVFIWINTNLLTEEFKDTIQTKIDPAELEGLYISNDGSRQLGIYLDPFTSEWIIENRISAV